MTIRHSKGGKQNAGRQTLVVFFMMGVAVGVAAYFLIPQLIPWLRITLAGISTPTTSLRQEWPKTLRILLEATVAFLFGAVLSRWYNGLRSRPQENLSLPAIATTGAWCGVCLARLLF